MSQVVLLHGSWLGGWMWEEVAHRLEQRGHGVAAPDFSGTGGVDTHRDELIELLDAEGISSGVVLVAHSYAGMPATAAAVARPGAISKIVYLDAYVPRAGQSAFDVLPEIRPLFEATATAGGYVAPLPLETFGITDAGETAKIEPRLRHWPMATHTEVSPGVPDSIKTAFLQCAQGRFFDGLTAELESDGWTVERLDLAHLAPVTHPEQTTEALLRHI